MSFSLTIMVLSLPTLYTRLLVESALTKTTGAVCPSITPIGFLCTCMHAVYSLMCIASWYNSRGHEGVPCSDEPVYTPSYNYIVFGAIIS